MSQIAQPRSPRPYQMQAIDRLTAAIQTLQNICFVMPTGAGKTFTVAWWIKNRILPLAEKKIVWIVVHQNPLPDQWMGDLLAVGLGGNDSMIGAIVSAQTRAAMKPANRTYATMRADVRVVVAMAPSLRNRLETVPDYLLPDILIMDEGHLVNEKGQASVNALITRCKDLKSDKFVEVLVTATPALHPSSKLPFTHLYPVTNWIQTVSAAELQAQNYWKKVIGVDPSPDYGYEAERLFAGMTLENSGEFSDTSQEGVMLQLIDQQIDEWEALQDAPGHPTIWGEVSRKVAKKRMERLIERGYTAQAVYSGTKAKDGTEYVDIESQKAIDAIVDLSIQHTCVVGRLQAGADIRPVCRKMFICTAFVSGTPTRLEQFWGRGTRPCEYAPGQWAELFVLDLGRNFGEHGMPFTIDWASYQQTKKMLVDPSQIHCQNKQCNHYHASIPAPLHPTDRKIKALVTMGVFEDETPIEMDDILVCHGCGLPVTFDRPKLELFAQWRAACVKAAAMQDHPPRPSRKLKKDGAGIDIGRARYAEYLTAGIMGALGLWKTKEPGDGQKEICLIDRSKMWQDKGSKLIEERGKMRSRQARVDLLPDNLKPLATKTLGQMVEGLPLTPGGKPATLEQALRRSLVLAYVGGIQPSVLFTRFPTDTILLQRYPKLGDIHAIKRTLYTEAVFKALDTIATTSEARGEVCAWLGAMQLALVEGPDQGRGTKIKISFLSKALEYIDKSPAIA